MGGAALVLGILWSGLPAGFDTFWEVGSQHGKFTIFHLGWDFNDPQNFVPGTLFGCRDRQFPTTGATL